MLKSIFDNITINNIIISSLSAICVIVVLPFILFWLKDKYVNRKKISVVAEEVYNVNSFNGVPELVNDSTNQYSNLIYNKVTVKSLNKEVISSIILNKIKKEPNEVADIRYDGGLYVDQQKYLLITYNNGNKAGETGDIKITINAIKDGTRDKITLETVTSPSLFIEPGVVTGQYKIDLLDYKDIFEKNAEYVFLEIDFENPNNSIPKGGGRYNRDTGRFEVNLGAGPGPSIQEVPFFDLSNSDKKEEKFCSQKIEKVSDVYFTVFVDKDCLLSYSVILKSNRNKIKGIMKHTIRIRIPKYKQEKTCKFGCFYLLVRENNPDLLSFKYSLETVKDLNKDLVFDKYETAKKYAKATFAI